MKRLEDEEKKASIRESNSRTVKNYAIAISVLATIVKWIVGG